MWTYNTNIGWQPIEEHTMYSLIEGADGKMYDGNDSEGAISWVYTYMEIIEYFATHSMDINPLVRYLEKKMNKPIMELPETTRRAIQYTWRRVKGR